MVEIPLEEVYLQMAIRVLQHLPQAEPKLQGDLMLLVRVAVAYLHLPPMVASALEETELIHLQIVLMAMVVPEAVAAIMVVVVVVVTEVVPEAAATQPQLVPVLSIHRGFNRVTDMLL